MPGTNANWLLLALWAQGALALVLLWVLGARRLPLIAGKAIRVEDIALSNDPWPDKVKQASNAFDNQFQLPVLLFVGGFAALYLGVTALEALLAWLFVICRIVHAAIHVTSNAVVPRFWAYTAGFALLILFWIDLGVRLFAVLLGNS